MKRLPVPSSKMLARRRMEGYYCTTVEDAEKDGILFPYPGPDLSAAHDLEDTGMLTACADQESPCSTAP